MADEEEFLAENDSDFLILEPEIPNILTKDEASDCLNCVGPTFRKVDEFFSYSLCTYAYVAMDLVGRDLTNVDVLQHFAHVMFLDLSKNLLKDDSLFPLCEMEQLVTLVVDDNRLETAVVPVFPQLQLLSLRKNRIATCEVNVEPNLEYLELEGNNIRIIQSKLWGPKRLPKLKELGLRDNGLKRSVGINFPNLVSLFLADNDITALEGLEALTNLKFLHLRNNPLKKLDGFSEANRKLFYLNVRGCKIKNAGELRKLAVLPRLERIVVLENPFTAKDYRVRVIAMLPNIRRIDKMLVEKNEKRKAKRISERGDGDDDDDDEEDDDTEVEDD